VAGCGGALLCAIHGATVENCLKHRSIKYILTLPSGRNILDGDSNRFWSQYSGLPFQQALAALFMLFVPVTGLWMSAVGVVI